MTTITHPRIDQTPRPTLRQLVQRWTAGVTTPLRWLSARATAIATAGQLGPAAETEVGRRTGARI